MQLRQKYTNISAFSSGEHPGFVQSATSSRLQYYTQLIIFALPYKEMQKCKNTHRHHNQLITVLFCRYVDTILIRTGKQRCATASSANLLPLFSLLLH